MYKLAFLAGSLCTALALLPADAAPSKKPAKKTHTAQSIPAKPDTKGTQQMAGGDGIFGETYTVTDGNGYGPFNFTLVSAEYSVERLNFAPGTFAMPKAGEKLLVLHYRVKNPNTSDFYFKPGELFQTVAADDQTRDDFEYSRRASQKSTTEDTFKPGQGYDDLITCAVVPGQGAIPKIILQYGRAGTSDKVIRYLLGAGKNKVQPLPAPYADPADPTGATALIDIPAKLGTTYVAGVADISVDSAAFAPGPFGDTAADDNKQFLVCTVTVTNKSWDKNYFKDGLTPVLITSDDEKTTDYVLLKGKRDEVREGEEMDPGASITVRMLFQVPKDVTAKSLTLSEAEDNAGGLSHRFVYDLSGVK